MHENKPWGYLGFYYLMIFIKRFLKTNHIDKYDIFSVIICIIFFSAGSLINLNNFWQYNLGYYDFGIFDRAIWNVSRFRPPIIDHFIVPQKIIFADHFNPSIFMFVPLYWLTQASEILLVMPSFSVAASGYIIYKIGKIKLKNSFAAVAVMMSYFLFMGIQSAIYSDFHDVTVATVWIMLCYYFFIQGKIKHFIICLIITLGFKESLSLFGIGFSIYILLGEIRRWKLAIVVFFISTIWGVVSTQYVIPYFSGSQYYYQASAYPFLPISSFLSHLVTPAIKIKTVVQTYSSFIFLPLLYFPLFPTIIFNFASRFLVDGSTRWDLGLHYSAEISPTLAVGMVYGLAMISSKFGRHVLSFLALISICVAVILHRFYFKGPMGLAFNPAFYNHTRNFYFLDKIIDQIPKDSTVAAQNNIASRLMHRREIYILDDKYEINSPEYIVLDMRIGQRPVYHLGISDPKTLLIRLLKDPSYKVSYHEGDQYIFRRI